MTTRIRTTGFFHVPELGTYLILAANLIAYGLTVWMAGSIAPGGPVLYRAGAIHAGVLAEHEYWRLVAYAFLHLGPVHIASNMICLLSWGGVLERKLGTTYYVLAYLASGIGAALVSILMHGTPFVTAGASGAISGIVGALFWLWIGRRIDIGGMFFAVNIGLNVLLLYGPLQVDWMAHLGGFVAGIAVTALLDGVEAILARTMRTKFPEYIKLNVVLVGLGLLTILAGLMGHDLFRLRTSWDELLIAFLVFLLILKLVDLILCIRHGLAALVLAFAGFYAYVPLVAAARIRGHLATFCAAGTGVLDPAGPLCRGDDAMPWILALCAFALTVLLLRRELARGWRDNGTLATRFRADRTDRRRL